MSTTSLPTWRLQDRLIRSLDHAGIGVQQMADELHVGRNTVSNYLHGRTKPNRATLRVWADVTGVPEWWLLGEAPPGHQAGKYTRPTSVTKGYPTGLRAA